MTESKILKPLKKLEWPNISKDTLLRLSTRTVRNRVIATGYRAIRLVRRHLLTNRHTVTRT